MSGSERKETVLENQEVEAEMELPEDCWADHVALLQDVSGAGGVEQQQHQPGAVQASDFLMLPHAHHHEVRTFIVY